MSPCVNIRAEITANAHELVAFVDISCGKLFKHWGLRDFFDVLLIEVFPGCKSGKNRVDF